MGSGQLQRADRHKCCLLTRLLCLVTVFLCGGAVAQEDSARSSESSGELEEIIVTAPQTWNSMRAEIRRAELKAVSLYNELNTDRQYHIHCTSRTPIDSYIPRRRCVPRYVQELEAQAARDFLDLGISFDMSGEAERHHRIMFEKMQTLMEQNPALYDAMLEYYEAGMTYQTAREERWGKDD